MTKNIELLNTLPLNWKNTYEYLKNRTMVISTAELCISSVIRDHKVQYFKSGYFANEEEWNFMLNKLEHKIQETIKLTHPISPAAITSNTLDEIEKLIKNKSDYLMDNLGKKEMEIKEVSLKEETIEIKKIYELIEKNEYLSKNSVWDLDKKFRENIDFNINGLNTQLQNFSELGKVEIQKLNDTIADMTQKTTALEKYNEVLEARLVKVEDYEGRISSIESTIGSFYDMYVSIRDVLTCNSCNLDDCMITGDNAILYVNNHEIVS